MSKCIKETAFSSNVAALSVSLSMVTISVLVLMASIVDKWWFN